MRRIAVLLLIVATAGCGGGGGDEEPEPGPPTRASDLPGDSASAGAQLVLRSGCLACHRVGELGNDGPGPDLTEVGERMPRTAIARTLVDPTPPMPSFADLPAADRRAIAEYLSSLR